MSKDAVEGLHPGRDADFVPAAADDPSQNLSEAVFLYNAYDLLALSLKLNQRNLQNALRRAPRGVIR